MIGFVYLQGAFYTLHEPQRGCDEQNQHSHPERVPPLTIPSIMPPLEQRPWCSIIVRLFQYDEAVFPVREMLQLSGFRFQVAAHGEPRINGIKVKFTSQLIKPLSLPAPARASFEHRLWKEQSQRP